MQQGREVSDIRGTEADNDKTLAERGLETVRLLILYLVKEKNNT